MLPVQCNKVSEEARFQRGAGQTSGLFRTHHADRRIAGNERGVICGSGVRQRGQQDGGEGQVRVKEEGLGLLS